MKLLRRLVTAGADPSLPAQDRKHVLISNGMSLFVGAYSWLTLPRSFVFGHGYLAVIAVQAVLFPLTVALNALGYRLAAKLWLGLFATASLSLAAWLSGAAGEMQLYLPTVVLGGWIVVGRRERWFGWMLTALGVAAFVFIDLIARPAPPAPVSAAELARFAGENRVGMFFILLGFAFWAFRETTLLEDALEREHGRAEKLLLNVLPRPIAERLKVKPGTIAERFEEATVLFADIVHFTQLSERVSPTELVRMLDEVFTRFDTLAERHGLEKIKTIGDAYMLAGGIPSARPDHAGAVAQMALDMQQVIAELPAAFSGLAIRIGIHAGPVVAGVIGRSKFAYDLWGDTVNTASRMESHGQPGRIHVSEQVFVRVRDQFEFEARGPIPVKGKGELSTYFLLRRRPAAFAA